MNKPVLNLSGMCEMKNMKTKYSMKKEIRTEFTTNLHHQCSEFLFKTSKCSSREPKCSKSKSQAAAVAHSLPESHSPVTRTAIPRYLLFLPQTGHLPKDSPALHARPQPPISPRAATLALCGPRVPCVHPAGPGCPVPSVGA